MNMQHRLGRLVGLKGSQQAVRLSFYLLVPAALGILYTLLRAGPAAVLPLHLALGVWLSLVFVGWWTANLIARAAWVVLRPWTPPLWFLCLVGSVGQALLLSPFYRTVYGWVNAKAGAGRLHSDPPLPEFSLVYSLELASAMAPGVIMMIAVNYTYDRLFGYPRLRYAVPVHLPTAQEAAARATTESAGDPPPPARVAPRLFERSRLPPGSEIWALTAEEHYVRIHSDRGTDLVRYRFADALEDVADAGMGLRVHRSWWVRPDRVEAWTDRGRSLELLLRDGTRVPVSLAFRAAALAQLGERPATHIAAQ
jgi:hypothetical protein